MRLSSGTFRQIAEFQYATEAIICKGKLESEGIEVFIKDHHTINADPLLSKAIGGVRLLVKKEDYEKALKIVTEINEFSVDNQGKVLHCPYCGAGKIKMVNTIRDLKSLIAFVFSFIFLSLPLYSRFKYRCEICHSEFDKENN